MGSHSVTCHPTEVRIPPLPPAEAGTRFSDPGGMQGWVDLCYVKATDRELNPRPVNRKSNALPLSHHATGRCKQNVTVVASCNNVSELLISRHYHLRYNVIWTKCLGTKGHRTKNHATKDYSHQRSSDKRSQIPWPFVRDSLQRPFPGTAELIVSIRSSSFICFRRKPVGIVGTGFYMPDSLLATVSERQKNKKH